MFQDCVLLIDVTEEGEIFLMGCIFKRFVPFSTSAVELASLKVKGVFFQEVGP